MDERQNNHSGGGAAGETQPRPESHGDFLLALFGKEHAINALAVGFPEDPTGNHDVRTRARMWNAQRHGKRKKALPREYNNYFCISTFKPSEDPKDGGEPRRRKALHYATHVVVIDDVGPKVPWENIKLPPSYVLLTSPNNCQLGYRLTVPERDAAKVERLIDGLIAKGLAINGKDPGMRGVTRMVRLPFGTNRKAKYGSEGFQCELKEWHPERAYTCEEIAETYGVSLAIPRHDAPARPRLTIPDEARRELAAHMLAALEAENRIIGEDPNAPGKWQLRCPFSDKHSTDDELGAAYWEPGFVEPSTGEASDKGGFKCWHGNCEHKHLHDLVSWARARGHLAVMHPSVAEEFYEVVASGQRLPAEIFNALERDEEGNILPGLVRNQETVIFHDNVIKNSIRFNVFTQRAEFPLYPQGRTLEAWKSWAQGEIERVYGVTFSAANIELRLHVLLERVSYDPLLEWALATAERWDGRWRTRRMLIEHAGATAQPAEYVEAVTWAFMLGAVHRALTPGYKFDHMLILEGLTGIRKSSLVKCIAPREEWYATGSLIVENKDAVADLAGKFIYEMDELEAFRRAKDFEAIRAFLSRTTDRARLSYRRDSADYPRRAVFVGTTEKDQYLPDGEHGTAQRRFWPVKITATEDAPIDTDWFRANREQLWAEALFAAVFLGEEPSLAGVVQLVQAEQKLRAHTPEEHPWYETLVKLWDDSQVHNRWPARIKSHEALHLVGVPTDRQTRANEQVMGKVLRSLGYKRVLLIEDGRRARVWVREIPR